MKCHLCGKPVGESIDELVITYETWPDPPVLVHGECWQARLEKVREVMKDLPPLDFTHH